MGFNPNYQTSEGTYFKDPVTMQDLTADEQRVSGPKHGDTGPFNWPRVKVSNGNVVKIAFRLFTADEKLCYKEYRQRGKTIVQKPVKEEQPAIKEAAHSHVEYIGGSVPAAVTLAFIRNADVHMGVWQFEGNLYDLLSIKGSNSYTPVPRNIIPRDDRERLNIC